MARPRDTHKHLPKYVVIIHGSYWYRPPGEKSVRMARVGDERAMYQFLADLEVGEPAGPAKTMADLFDRYEREIVPLLAPRTQKDYHRHLKILRLWCGHMRPEELKKRDIGKFLAVERGKIQRNRQVAVLSAVFAKAVGKWYDVEHNPCLGVERNPSRHRDRYIEDHEYIAVYNIAPERVQIAMDLALLTGQRQGDILTLKWDAVSDDGVKFQQGKTGKKLIVGLSPSLSAVLARAKRLLPDLPREYVIRTERKGTPYTSEGFRAIWQRTMKKVMSRRLLEKRFVFHDLRAKSVSDSVTLDAAFERAGHQTMQMTRSVYDRNYRKVTPLR